MLTFRMCTNTLLRQCLFAATIVMLSSQVARPAPILNSFNLVVGGNLVSNSEVEGRTLVGGNLSGTASNYGIALTPSSAFSGIDSLIVGGDITSGNVNVAAGDIRVGGSVTGNVNRNGVGSDLFQHDATVSGVISSVLGQLQLWSSYFAGLTPNSTVNNPAGPSAVTFNATAGPDNLAVFSLDGAVFSDPQSQQFDLVAGTGMDLMIVNVYGTSINFNEGNFVGGFTNPAIRPFLLWNFVEAQTLELNRSWFGTIMAPSANLRTSTVVDGSVFIGRSFDQRGEVHLPLFNAGQGDAPVPEPATIGLMSVALLAMGSRKYLKRSGAKSEEQR
jgi:choice-of-anchor A domain-containing protein